jgi:hypothetical protein
MLKSWSRAIPQRRKPGIYNQRIITETAEDRTDKFRGERLRSWPLCSRAGIKLPQIWARFRITTRIAGCGFVSLS